MKFFLWDFLNCRDSGSLGGAKVQGESQSKASGQAKLGN